jgi:hypothetical protein
VGPIFLLAATMFGLVIQITNIVTEKELKLRQVRITMHTSIRMSNVKELGS